MYSLFEPHKIYTSAAMSRFTTRFDAMNADSPHSILPYVMLNTKMGRET